MLERMLIADRPVPNLITGRRAHAGARVAWFLQGMGRANPTPYGWPVKARRCLPAAAARALGGAARPAPGIAERGRLRLHSADR